MTDKKVSVSDTKEGRPDREFSFDHAFWSHDCFETDQDGYNRPDASGKYTDQLKVWNLLGEPVLDKAWKGLNCTMFAYGQTGSGKSYSTFGYGSNRGIVPMAADRLFQRINATNDPAVTFEVTVQMVEIYMEKIQDLLIAQNKRGEPLQVKTTKAGVHVAGAV